MTLPSQRRQRFVPNPLVFCAKIICCVLLAGMFPGCSHKNSPADYEAAAEFVATADSVILYEGLPHQDGEMEILKRELAEKQTVAFGEYPFYAEPMPLTAQDAAVLTAIFDGSDAFYGPPEASVCGKFHPDYAIEWKKGDETVAVLVCFMCREAIVVAATEKMEFGMAGEPMKKVMTLLKDRWQKRPQTEFAKVPRR
jgi:hypothetical protein